MKNNYIIIGDSITYGIGDYEDGGWSAMLKKFIVNKDDSKICNNFVQVAGFPGATSKDIINKIDSILECFKYNEFNNIVILSIGINDTQCFNGNCKVSRDNYRTNIENIIKKITNRRFELIVLGLTRIELDEKLEFKPNKFYDNSNISEYDKDLRIILENDSILKELYNQNKIKYVPMQDVLQKDDFIDGLHPNTKGHRKIFEQVKKYIKE